MVGELNHQFGVKGPENSSWVSGIRVGPNGYVLVKNYTHPYRTCDDDIRLHRLIMEHYLRATHQYRFLQEIEGGWYLNPEFDVHHVDENRLNNSLSNLEVMTRGEHTALHNAARSAKGKLADSGQSTGSQLTKNVRLDAGLDILSCVKTTILAGGSQIISTGIKINVPDGFVGLIWSRSGLSVKHKIEVGAGCIDSGYTGEVLVHLYNLGDKAYEVNIGQKIAQLLTIPVNLDFYERVASLEDSERGDNGFGSTGDFVQ
jgi:dUTP pyrophosphatase